MTVTLYAVAIDTTESGRRFPSANPERSTDQPTARCIRATRSAANRLLTRVRESVGDVGFKVVEYVSESIWDADTPDALGQARRRAATLTESGRPHYAVRSGNYIYTVAEAPTSEERRAAAIERAKEEAAALPQQPARVTLSAEDWREVVNILDTVASHAGHDFASRIDSIKEGVTTS